MGEPLPPIKRNAGLDNQSGSGEKWVPKNWSKKDTKKMSQYEDVSKDAAESQEEARKRLRDIKKRVTSEHVAALEEEEEWEERSKHEKLIGQLNNNSNTDSFEAKRIDYWKKAAEARDRIRIMRLRYQANRGQEINHLIACQPTARKAVRLQALLPVKPRYKIPQNKMDKLSRARVQALIDDSANLLTMRIPRKGPKILEKPVAEEIKGPATKRVIRKWRKWLRG